jgi:hypothetical protein
LSAQIIRSGAPSTVGQLTGTAAQNDIACQAMRSANYSALRENDALLRRIADYERPAAHVSRVGGPAQIVRLWASWTRRRLARRPVVFSRGRLFPHGEVGLVADGWCQG